MDQITHSVRRASWLAIINECQSRPADVTAKQWLADNGIRTKSYYYWQRKFRAEAYEQMPQLPSAAAETEVTFAELPIPDEICQTKAADINSICTDDCPAAVLKANGFAIELSNNISHDLLAALLREVSHA